MYTEYNVNKIPKVYYYTEWFTKNRDYSLIFLYNYTIIQNLVLEKVKYT